MSNAGFLRNLFQKGICLALPLSAVIVPSAGTAQMIPVASCVEYPPNAAGASYVARFSVFNPYTTSAYIPTNTQLNAFTPFRPPHQSGPSTFYTGYTYEVASVSVGQGYSETWRLDNTSVQINSLVGLTTAGAPPVAPVCPILLRPATLNYTSAGTYSNVYLAQVNSGPGGGVKISAQPSPGITVTNLVYTPGDTASPIANSSPYEPNPNSVYGTVTVSAGASTDSSIALAVSVNGITNAQTIVPLTFTPPAYTISGTADAGGALTVASGNTLPINVLFTYSGAPKPTGAITIQVDGTGLGLSNQSCVYKTGGAGAHQNCSISYTASGAAGNHTLTFSQAADSNFSAFSGSATIQVTPSNAPAIRQVIPR